MQPFVNPNFFNYSQYQQPNPYLQRMENLQQFQQTLQPTINTQMPLQTFNPFGKIVENEDMVRVTDIPMDGNVYYFPKADGTEIYSKQFMADGRTRILTFKPVLVEQTEKNTENDLTGQFDGFKELLGGIQSEIQVINEKIDKLTKPSAKAKKEGVLDE